MRRSITLDMVAKEAHVSAKTASIALRTERGVASDTAQRVRAAAARLGYQPRRKATGLLGAVTPSTNHPSYGHLLEVAQDYAVQHGYYISIRDTGGNVLREMAAIEELDRRRVRGLILLTPRAPLDWLESLARVERPILVINTELAPVPTGFACVSADNERGMRRAVEYLLDLGHQHIAYLAGPSDSWSNRARQEAFQLALEGRGHFDPRFVIEMEHPVRPDCAWGADACRRALELDSPAPTGIMAYSDLLAIGAIRQIFDDPRGFRIPDHLSVVGFDDLEIVSFITPRLTTVQVPRYRMANLGMQTLIDLIEHGPGSSPSAPIRLDTSLKQRQSTGPVLDSSRVR